MLVGRLSGLGDRYVGGMRSLGEGVSWGLRVR